MKKLTIPIDDEIDAVINKLGTRDFGIDDDRLARSLLHNLIPTLRGTSLVSFFLKNLSYDEVRFYSVDCTIRVYLGDHVLSYSVINGRIGIGSMYCLTAETTNKYIEAFNKRPSVSKLPYPDGDVKLDFPFTKRPIKMVFNSVTQLSNGGLMEYVLINSKEVEVDGKMKRIYVDGNDNEIHNPDEALFIVEGILRVLERRQIQFGERLFEQIDNPFDFMESGDEGPRRDSERSPVDGDNSNISSS